MSLFWVPWTLTLSINFYSFFIINCFYFFLKLWKKHYPVNGQVTQHLSPFEQKAVAPMFKDAPLKILKKVADFLKEAGPALAIGIMVYLWSEKKHKEIAFHHRS